MKFKAADIVIRAKVFVPEEDINQLVGITGLTEQEAFDALAREKIGEALPTDDPMKVREVLIDLATLS